MGISKRGTTPFGRLNEGGSREGERSGIFPSRAGSFSPFLPGQERGPPEASLPFDDQGTKESGLPRPDGLAMTESGRRPRWRCCPKKRLTNPGRTFIISAVNALRKRDRQENGSERGRVRAPAFSNRSATSERPARSGTGAPVTERRDTRPKAAQSGWYREHFAPVRGGVFLYS